MGHPSPELPGREMGRGIYDRRWDIQDGNWQIGRWEEEFTKGDGTSKTGTGRLNWGNWQLGRREEEFTAGR